MKPYSISCTTCGARLKVRDEQAIGQLSLCPKCGSMVMITPPAPGGEAVAAGPSAASGSSPQLIVGGRSATSDFDDAAALLADTKDDTEPKSPPRDDRVSRAASQAREDTPASPKKKGEAGNPQSAIRSPQSHAPPPIEPPTESMSSIELDPMEAGGGESPLARASAAALAEAAPEAESSPDDRRAAMATADSDEGAVAALPLTLENQAWTTPTQAAWQRYGMLSVAVLAALGLVVGVLVLLWPSANPPVAAAGDDETNPAVQTTGDQVNNGVKDKGVADGASQEDDSPLQPSTNSDSDPRIDSSGAAVDHAGATKNGTDDETPAAVDAPSDAAAPPLFTAGDDSPAGDDAGDEVATADTGLGDLTPYIDGFSVPDAPTRDPRADGATDGEPPPREEPGDLRPRPESRIIDIEARLADKMAGIDAGGAPLAKFIELISQWSTIPITIDPAALAQAQTSPSAPMSLTMTDASVAQVLKAGLITQRLAYEVRDDQIVVIAAPRTSSRFLTANYDVADISADADAMNLLIDHVRALVAPATWEAAGGEGVVKAEGGKLSVRNTQDAHFAVHVLLQKLRVARGMEPRSSFDPAMFELTPRTARARAKLNTHVVAVFHAERPLMQILGHLEKSAGVNLLVDWQSLLEAGWPTTSTATLVADDVPLAVALDQLLGPMELSYRAVDERTIQIVSRKSLNTQAELEFYSISDALAGDATADGILAALKKEFGEDRFADPGGPFAIRYDEPSQCLLVLLPQEKQRSLARRLAP